MMPVPNRPPNGWTVETLKQYIDAKIERDRQLYDKRFEGFPQEYAKVTEHDTLARDVQAIRTDHVQRREFEALGKTLDEDRGARRWLALTVTVIAMILISLLGVVWSRELTSGDVSAQIAREAPAAGHIEHRLATLEALEAREHGKVP